MTVMTTGGGGGGSAAGALYDVIELILDRGLGTVVDGSAARKAKGAIS